MTNASNNITSAADLSSQVAFDANGLNRLKQSARENSPEAIKEVARQFEAIFMNMMLKSMRDATPQDSPFDNDQSRTFTTMLDQQLTSNLANKGLGLADVLARQLSQGGYDLHNTMEQAVSDKPADAGQNVNKNNGLISNPLINQSISHYNLDDKSVDGVSKSDTSTKAINETSTVSVFQKRMELHAKAASEVTGIPAHLMLGQAALESGWGKRELRGMDGTPSHNLFGIKAGSNWSGKTIDAVTTEYIGGIKQKRVEKFRAYESYEDSFKDFANLMRNNPRYENVLANLHSSSGYAQAMQKAGYATDPFYANKLISVLQRFTPS